MNDSAELRRRHPEGARFSEWLAPDGWKHRRMDWPQPAGAKLRGTLLFAGGRGDFIEKYLEAQAHWHGRGWNVVAFDWRSQGASRGDIVGGNVESFDPLVEDLAALLAELAASSPAPHVAIGHSMGGHLLLRTLIEQKPALAAAVLVAPMIAVNSGPLPAAFTNLAAEWMCRLGWRDSPIWKPIPAPAFDRRRFLTSSPERYEDELYGWQQQPGFNLGAPSWGGLRAASRSAAAFTPAALVGVDLPLLLLATQADRLVSVDAIRRVASWLPRAELE
ncbi:MAG: alpha/beta hydrolase, partial [Sphingosinicella sp.]